MPQDVASEITEALKELESVIKSTIVSIETESSLEECRLRFLGKKGELTKILKGLGKVTSEQRANLGQNANRLKELTNQLLAEKKTEIKSRYYASLAEKEWLDLTETPKALANVSNPSEHSGHIHPISQMQERLENIFVSMGFSITDGPQVETDQNNFGALNFTDDHPAREMQDTFYTDANHLLRTHTSAVQVRGMREFEPPLRMISPGRVFRFEEIDASHEHTFYQMEGMVIERQVSVSNLLYLMQTLLKEVFEADVKVRLRPGYFPFVEPGFELDMHCMICDGHGCRVCKNSGWVEILPCGLVHPNVLKAGNIDPERWQGAAFGLGLNRLVMMQYGIEDIRHFQNGNPGFLHQF